MALVTVLKCSIETLYPSVNGETGQIPSVVNTTFGVNEPHESRVRLLWTSMHDKVRGAWTLNHFVTVIPEVHDSASVVHRKPLDNPTQDAETNDDPDNRTQEDELTETGR